MPGIFRYGAGDGTRTRDSLLGRQVLYQLSYSRRRAHARVARWSHAITPILPAPVRPHERAMALTLE